MRRMTRPLLTQSGHDAARPPAHGTKRTTFLFVAVAVLVASANLLELTDAAPLARLYVSNCFVVLTARQTDLCFRAFGNFSPLASDPSPQSNGNKL